MVDKINRPEAPNPYEVIPTKETHDEGQKQQHHQQSEPEHHDDDEYSSPGATLRWDKFSGTTTQRELIRLSRSDIQDVMFRQAILHSRNAILEMDLRLKDGTVLQRARIVSANMDDYWKWKGWIPGQLMPLELLISDPILEVSILHLTATAPRPAIVPRAQATAATATPRPGTTVMTRIKKWLKHHG